MLTFDDVLHAPLATMKAAADDWAELRARLDRLAEDARTTMAAKARDEYWRGENAEVTKAFVDRTAKEFGDAAQAAGGIHKVLEDGYRAFRRARDELRRIVEHEAPGQGLHVDAKGTVSARAEAQDAKGQESLGDPRLANDPDHRDLRSRLDHAVAAMQQRIRAVVETCDDADQACSHALKADIAAGRRDFSAPKYTSLDAEEAARAVELARKGRDLTHAELERLNELLKDNSRSQEFSRAFYDGLGPKGALEFFGRLSTDTYDGTKPDTQRLADVQALQKNLGLTLATATRGGDAWTDTWSTQMRRLGTERIPLVPHDSSPAYGYQLLGGILRHGNYDRRFLVPIAEHVTQLHVRDPHLFENSKPYAAGWLTNQYNPSGVNGAGFDPVIPVLEALGHSPEAAKEFFSKTPVTYGDDGGVGDAYDLGTDADGEPRSYLDVFASGDYAFFPDVEGRNPDDAAATAGYMPDALGHALEAATLGHAWDDPAPRLLRDETSGEIMDRVVSLYGGDPELLKKHHSALTDSLGNMAAGYIDDLDWAVDLNSPDSVFAPSKSPDDHPKFGRENAIAFLGTLGQHPDAYATVSTAERLYTTSVLEAQVGHDGSIDEGRARGAVKTGALVQGILDTSRADQVEAEGLKKHEDYEKEQQSKAAWVQFGATVGIAAGVAFLPATAAVGAAAVLVPLAVDTGSGAMETLAGQVVGDWSEKSLEEHKDGTEDRIHEHNRALYTAGRYSAEAPMMRFLEEHRDHVDSGFREDMIQSVSIGYGDGNARARQTGSAPETG